MTIQLFRENDEEPDQHIFDEICDHLAIEIPNLNIYNDQSIKRKVCNYDINTYIVSIEQITKLNKEFRNKDKSTDVLTFNSLELNIQKKGYQFLIENIPAEDPFNHENLLSEIFICREVAQLQAKQLNHSYQSEIIRLLVHGCIHSLGINHERSKLEATFMLQQEEILLLKLNTKEKIQPLTNI